MNTNRKGEIMTFITIGAVIVFTVLTFISGSNLYKTKETIKSKAAEVGLQESEGSTIISIDVPPPQPNIPRGCQDDLECESVYVPPVPPPVYSGPTSIPTETKPPQCYGRELDSSWCDSLNTQVTCKSEGLIYRDCPSGCTILQGCSGNTKVSACSPYKSGDSWCMDEQAECKCDENGQRECTYCGNRGTCSNKKCGENKYPSCGPHESGSTWCDGDQLKICELYLGNPQPRVYYECRGANDPKCGQCDLKKKGQGSGGSNDRPPAPTDQPPTVIQVPEETTVKREPSLESVSAACRKIPGVFDCQCLLNNTCIVITNVTISPTPTK